MLMLIKRFLKFLRGLFTLNRENMAKITLEDENEAPFEFDLDQLIFIGYDPKTQKIVLCIKGFAPRYLPLTMGNFQFLQTYNPFLEIQSSKNLKTATTDLLQSESKDKRFSPS